MKKKSFFIALFLLGVFSLLGARVSTSQSPKPNESVPSVKTLSIAPETFQETVSFAGFIKGVNQTNVAPSIAGSIIKLTKEEGDTVYQGETLAIIDGRELTAGQKGAALSFQSIEKTLKGTKKYYDQKVDEAQTMLDNASADEKASAEEAVRSAKRFRDVQMASIEGQKTSLAGILSVSEASSSHTIIKAPFSGIITQKNASLGSYVSPGMSIYSIASPKNLEVAVSLPITIAQRITKGSEVLLKDDEATYEGFVFAQASLVEDASTRALVRVHFASTSNTASLFLGKYIETIFAVGDKREAMLIPTQAIISEYDDTFVYKVEGNRVKKQSVTLGKNTGGKTEVLSGISTHDHIVIEGEHTLVDNQLVKEIYDAK